MACTKSFSKVQMKYMHRSSWVPEPIRLSHKGGKIAWKINKTACQGRQVLFEAILGKAAWN